MSTNLTHSSSSQHALRRKSTAARLVALCFALMRACFAIWVLLTPHYEDRWKQRAEPVQQEGAEP